MHQGTIRQRQDANAFASTFRYLRTPLPVAMFALLVVNLGSTPLAAQTGVKRQNVEKSEAKKPEAKRQSVKGLQLFDGKTLRGWKAATKFDFEKHGDVKIKDGALHMGVGKPASGIVCTHKLPRDNYEISLDAQRTDGSDFFCGLTFPVGKEYCSLIIGGWGGGVIGLSNVDNTSAIENETTGYQNFKNGQWHRVRLRVTPKAIEAWIDKKQVVELEREGRKFNIWWEQEPMRPLGIANWNTASAYRKIEFLDLDPKRAPATAKSIRQTKPAK